MNDIRIPIKFESASAVLCPLDEDAKNYLLSSLYSQERGRGHAKGLLEMVTKKADEEDWTLILSVMGFGHPTNDMLSDRQLVELYSRYGFEVIDRYRRKPIRMLRRPSRKIHAP